MMSTLRGILGEGADDKIKKAMEVLGSVNNEEDKKTENDAVTSLTSNQKGIDINPETLQMISQIKSMVDSMSRANDSRSELLQSLRPFLRSDRQKSIDKAIRILNLGRFSGIIGK